MNILVSLMAKDGDALRNSAEDKGQEHRPSVCLAKLEELHFDHYFIFGDTAMFGETEEYSVRKQEIKDAIRKYSPDTKLHWEEQKIEDPWDLREVFGIFKEWSDRIWKKIPPGSNLYIHTSSGTHIQQISLFLLLESRHLPGKIIQTLPDFPWYRVIDLADEEYSQVINRFVKEPMDVVNKLKDGIETKNRAYNEMINEIVYVAAKTTDPILLTGPTGAGKTQLAKRIYELKKGENLIHGTFVAANCATLRGDQAMSTLFGHKKGAFTGATADRSGLLKTAEGGILFLDEIGELGPDEQAMLLRAIEEKSFFPLGADNPVTSTFQLICGTNHDLRKDATEGLFRLDLLERINTWPFKLPGLAERREDIEPNLDKELNTLGKGMVEQARIKFLDFAMNYSWPGNFREFNKMLKRAATLSEGPYISQMTIQKEIDRICQIQSHEEYNEKVIFSHNSDSVDRVLKHFLGERYPDQLEPIEVIKLRYVVEVCLKSNSISDAGRKLYHPCKNDAQKLKRYLHHWKIDFYGIKDL